MTTSYTDFFVVALMSVDLVGFVNLVGVGCGLKTEVCSTSYYPRPLFMRFSRGSESIGTVGRNFYMYILHYSICYSFATQKLMEFSQKPKNFSQKLNDFLQKPKEFSKKAKSVR